MSLAALMYLTSTALSRAKKKDLGGLLTMFFDGAIRKHYDEFARCGPGERAHLGRHYGKAYAALWKQRRRQVMQRRLGEDGRTASPHGGLGLAAG